MSPRASERGVTLLEVVVVVLVAAVVAAVAIPSLTGRPAMDAALAARRLSLDVRYAQRLAMTRGEECGVRITGERTYEVFRLANGVQTIERDPLTLEPLAVTFEEGVAIAPPDGVVSFDARGRPLPLGATPPSFTIGALTVAIEPETGAVRP